MRKLVFLFALLLLTINTNAQELNCLVNINYNQVQGSNTQVFKTLQQALAEFINQTKWTNREVKPEERINCAMNIIINSRNDNTFDADLQIQSTRPVYGATYETPLLNIRDNDFNFSYNEFEPLIYNINSFDSNLVSTIVFYVNIILGVDADSFKLKAGEPYLKEAQNAMLQAQQSGLSSWQNVVGKQNRFLLIDNLLSSKLSDFRIGIYNYHRKGLDNFSSNSTFAKQTVEDAVISMENLFNKTVGNYLIRVFFDAKSDEIVNIYSEGPKTRKLNRLTKVLQKISPNNSSKWKNIN
ncbi:DUF4835 family protein [uncultured Polaribacter sp.]|uniref:type IX secretion system protein PorD n=1 Tax=uncultured Polaribacter sp. TaxID=174711 RepID=UPI00262799CB|nr:DUF4835 family protein [uncultured Polaribacter sp.]